MFYDEHKKCFYLDRSINMKKLIFILCMLTLTSCTKQEIVYYPEGVWDEFESTEEVECRTNDCKNTKETEVKIQ